MRAIGFLVIVMLIVLLLLGACSPSIPAATSAKPTGAPASSAPTTAATAAPVVAPAAPSATSAATKPAAAAPKIKRGGILRDVASESQSTQDEHISNSGNLELRLMYDPFLTYKMVSEKPLKFETQPGLAESYKVVNPTTVELTLRKGVKFHDGSDFTAEVAKWNVERAMTHPKSKLKSTVESIKSVEVVNENTLRLNLKAPSAIMDLLLSFAPLEFMGMLSKTAMDTLGEEQFGNHPVGTGPMKMKEWVRDQRIVLEKFPGHWEKGDDGQPLPYLDGYHARVILDMSVALVEMRAGTVDVFFNLEPKDAATVERQPELAIQEIFGQQRAFPFLRFNAKPGTNYPFSNNQKLRAAADYAVDRVGMAKALGFGMAQPAYYNYWFPGMLGWDETLPRREFDLAKAKQLVSEAGFPNGVDVEAKIVNRSTEVRSAEALQAMWAAAGIRLKATVLDRVPWTAAGTAGDFEAYSHRSTSYDDILLRPAFRKGSPLNYGQYFNVDVERIFSQADSEYDSNKRAQIYKDMQKILNEDGYYVSGYMLPRLAAMNKRVKNMTTDWNLRYIWLDQ